MSQKTREGTPERPFAPDSPWNTPIPRSAKFADNPWIHYKDKWWCNWSEWSAPHYIGTASAPLTRVTGSNGGRPVIADVHLPEGAKPDPAGDGSLVLYDTVTGRVWDFYQFSGTGREQRKANRITVDDYRTGRGWPPPGSGCAGANGCRASGAHWAAGMVRGHHFKTFTIDHALALAIGTAQLKRGPVPPATCEDGNSRTYRSEPDGLPMGTRLAIPPDVNIDRTFQTPVARMLARAFQTYGGYITDRGGAVEREAAEFGLYADTLSVTAAQIEEVRVWWKHRELLQIRRLLKIVS
jgi:hypothetical protein